ncbi:MULTISPECIES: hypothetical protein [Cupriavidus]|uniref:hypothetical protein n=1 Tax=Cupriavidus TaxID=106589 RepID=UPI00157AACFF|nr:MULTISPECIES: hypothetical protein [Cupriavidus]MBB1632618.1 hypothetical protein [Cupriavidus sp. UME77]NUA27051.1 hypothetical protein [Cupriavidus basilensis]
MNVVELQVVALSGILEGKYYPPSLRALARLFDAKVYWKNAGAIYELPAHEIAGEMEMRAELIRLYRDLLLLSARELPVGEREAYVADQRSQLRVTTGMLEAEVEIVCALAFAALDELGTEILQGLDWLCEAAILSARFRDFTSRETEMFRRALAGSTPIFVAQ